MPVDRLASKKHQRFFLRGRKTMPQVHGGSARHPSHPERKYHRFEPGDRASWFFRKTTGTDLTRSGQVSVRWPLPPLLEVFVRYRLGRLRAFRDSGGNPAEPATWARPRPRKVCRIAWRVALRRAFENSAGRALDIRGKDPKPLRGRDLPPTHGYPTLPHNARCALQRVPRGRLPASAFLPSQPPPCDVRGKCCTSFSFFRASMTRFFRSDVDAA